jgi:hypothetical protein
MMLPKGVPYGLHVKLLLCLLLLCDRSLQKTMRVWQHSTGKILKTLSMPPNMSAGELLVTLHVWHCCRSSLIS